MSTVKISELALISQLNANTSNTLFVAVDIPTGVTGKFTGHTLAQGLYSNEVLNVGLNPVLYSNVAAQFSGNSGGYLQVNLQNFTGSGSTDYVASTSDSTNANSFIDMGIDGKSYNDQETYSAFKPYDGYLYVHGPTDIGYSGNLIIGTASHHANIVFMVGGTMSDNVRGYITRDGYNLLANVSVKGVLTTSVGLKFGDGSMQNTAANPIAFSQASYTQANTATTIAQSAYGRANSEIIGTAAYVQANVATIIGQASYLHANGAFASANSEIIGTAAYVQANTATIIGQSAYGKANSASNTAISAYVQANTATGTSQAAYGQANTASSLAQGALANTTGTFAGDLTITGNVEPQKGFVYTTRVPAGNQTTIAINYATDSMIKANLVADLTVTHSNFLSGKGVELWLVNIGGSNRTVTHGLTALNSTTNSTTFTIPATSCAHLKYFNISGDLANTFVSVVHA